MGLWGADSILTTMRSLGGPSRPAGVHAPSSREAHAGKGGAIQTGQKPLLGPSSGSSCLLPEDGPAPARRQLAPYGPPRGLGLPDQLLPLPVQPFPVLVSMASKDWFWSIFAVLVNFGCKNWFWLILTEKTRFGRFWPKKLVLVDGRLVLVLVEWRN